ncbi:MAG: PepSY-associated TM helix domain-containing protein [Acidobacteriota bacterium]
MTKRVWTKLRSLLVWAHRWFGLLAGLWLFFLAATGCFVVFYQEIDRALNRDLWYRPVAGERLPVQRLVEAAEASIPGSYASFANLPNRPGEPFFAYLAARPGSDVEIPRKLHVFVDPYNGEVLATRVFGAFKLDRLHFAQLVYQLHRDLKLGNLGAFVLGLVAFLWIWDHFAAAWISFPNPRRWWQSWVVKGGARGYSLVYRLHRAGGLWLAPVTLALAVSGVYFNWNSEFRAAVSWFSPLTPRPHQTAPRLEEPLLEAPVDVDQALAVARRETGGAEADRVSIMPQSGLYLVRLFDRRDISIHGGRFLYVSMEDGAVVSDRHARDGTLGDTLLAWQYPLHSGQAFGWPGRLLIFAAGLVICAMVATGFVIWAKKRRGRVALAARRRAAPRTPAPVAIPEPASRLLQDSRLAASFAPEGPRAQPAGRSRQGGGRAADRSAAGPRVPKGTSKPRISDR